VPAAGVRLARFVGNLARLDKGPAASGAAPRSIRSSTLALAGQMP
jgi:hypothetical protein